MTPLLPTAAETATLRFWIPIASQQRRVLLATALFALGAVACASVPWLLFPAGLLAILGGHLVLWVKTQTTAPGGATPAHEDLWAPVEDDWLQRVEALERNGERWDVTPWDVSNLMGCATLLCMLGALAAAAVFAAGQLGVDSGVRLAVSGVALLAPLWINGMRTTWNPSELRKKGQALDVARQALDRIGRAEFDLVPTLALREGRRGKYPVDARLMLRPSHEDGSGFLGVQLQVAMNSVQGTDYPYLYAVVLGKDGFRLPDVPARQNASGVDLVVERGEGEGVRYLVVRQHADQKGGWHTKPDQIAAIVTVALDIARRAWQANAKPPA